MLLFWLPCSYCGFGKDIPSNGFVAAWPVGGCRLQGARRLRPSAAGADARLCCLSLRCLQFIETAPNGQGYPQPGTSGQGCGACMEVSCVPQFVESADGSIYLDRRSVSSLSFLVLSYLGSTTE